MLKAHIQTYLDMEPGCVKELLTKMENAILTIWKPVIQVDKFGYSLLSKKNLYLQLGRVTVYRS